MLLAVAPAAAAQESTGACSAPELRGATCARFAVPLDHASAQDPDDPRSRALGIS